MNPRSSHTILTVLSVAVGLTLSAATFAQGHKGVLKGSTYIDKVNGYRVKVPFKWKEVPTQIDEQWIVSQFQCHREYEGHHKMDMSAFHRPVMRVIMFDEEVIKNTKYDTVKAGRLTTTTIRLPYRNYKDYVKRNLSKGGFFFTKEEEGKMGKLQVSRYEVKVEKMANNGRRQFVAWVYKGQGISFAVEFEYLTHHFKKIRKYGDKCLKTFKFIERKGAVAEEKLISTSKWTRRDWKKMEPRVRHDKRKAIAEQRIRKAINSLPKGWVAKETKHFVVLTHASKKYTKRVLIAVECCRAWLENRLGNVTPEYVTRGIVRICRTTEEMNLYRTGSRDAFSADDREVVTYENKGAGNTGSHYGGLFFGLYNQYMYDKDEYLYWHVPAWIDYAYMDYFLTATIKGKTLQFKQSQHETNSFREMRRKKVKVLTPKELMHVTTEILRKGNNLEKYTSEQILRYLRFMEGKGKKHKLFKGNDFILKYMRETIVQAEDYIDKNPATRRSDADTEAEEEEQANSNNKYFSVRRTKICENINKVLCNWTEAEWASLTKTFERYCK